MASNDLILDVSVIDSDLHNKYFNYPGQNGKILEFTTIAGWRDYLESLRIQSSRVPIIHANQYHVALRLMLLGWADGFVIKPAELQALRSLEGALAQGYFDVIFELEQKEREQLRQKCGLNKSGKCQRCQSCSPIDRMKYRPGLCKYLDYMVAHDSLPNIFHNETKKKGPDALHNIRNGLAHGSPFNNGSWGGLMESVRDVIEHAYRNHPDQSEMGFVSVDIQNNQLAWFGSPSLSGFF